MAVDYTTEAKVKYMIENLDASLTSAHYAQFIKHAKGLIVATMKFEFITKVPDLVEQTTTDLAALYAFVFNPEAAASYQFAASKIAFLENRVNASLQLLADPEILTYFKTLKYA
jgi:hypothetical protein